MRGMFFSRIVPISLVCRQFFQNDIAAEAGDLGQQATAAAHGSANGTTGAWSTNGRTDPRAVERKRVKMGPWGTPAGQAVVQLPQLMHSEKTAINCGDCASPPSATNRANCTLDLGLTVSSSSCR